jgi:ornithine cyclodeaminase
VEIGLGGLDLVGIMEESFAAYSRGEAVVPPVGELLLEDPPGEVHIKHGYIRGDEFFVIKVASGFYRNPESGLPSGHGLMLLFSRKTGAPEAVILDEGYLTDMRTAAAGAVAARHLASHPIRRIGILGGGVQGRLQLRLLESVTDCRRALVWMRDAGKFQRYRSDLDAPETTVELAEAPAEVAAECDLIVTTTPSTTPLLRARDVRPGTHLTAVGSDTGGKIELDPEILGLADAVVVDSLSQSESRGEVYRAVEAGAIRRKDVLELGDVVRRDARVRTSEDQITVCDLTGVAVQDIRIAEAVYRRLENERESER